MYAASTRHGLLSLTSVLSSLAPAVTVLLAWRLIGERLDRSRWAGVAAAVAGVLLIAAG
jgi:drug/metabolite transporter (DMT)-like permease